MEPAICDEHVPKDTRCYHYSEHVKRRLLSNSQAMSRYMRPCHFHEPNGALSRRKVRLFGGLAKNRDAAADYAIVAKPPIWVRDLTHGGAHIFSCRSLQRQPSLPRILVFST